MSESEKVEVPNTTPQKEKKEKKVMTPEKLEQLARARRKALEIRQAGASIKAEQQEMAEAALEEKLERERLLNEAVKKSLLKNEINNDGLQTVPLYRNNVVPNIARRTPKEEEEEEEEEEAPPVIVKKKTKKPIKTKIVIEQSSDDEDEFHTNEHVIFVKRKSKNDSIKKVVPATTPVPPNTPELPKTQYKSQQAQPDFTSFGDIYANGGFMNRRQYY